MKYMHTNVDDKFIYNLYSISVVVIYTMIILSKDR